MPRNTRILRDCVAAVLAALLLSPLILGSVRRRPPELSGGPPDAGTLVEEEKTPERHAPAGDGSGPKQENDKAETAPPKQADKPATTVQAAPQTPPPRQNEAQASTAAQLPAPPQSAAQTPTTPSNGTNAPTLQPEPPPKPTAVEQQPKPVAQMTPEEIQRAVAEYRTWVYKGRIRLLLEHSQVTPVQLNSVTAFYVLTHVDRSDKALQEVWVDSAGSFRDDQNGTLAEDMLTGDLRSDQQWPPMLAQKAQSAFGPQYLARAKFYLTDGCALRIYRVLAHAVRDKTVPPGTDFVLKLSPDPQGQIAVELVRTIYAPKEL